MFIVPTHVLKILAGLIWYAGSIALFMKGHDLQVLASHLQPESWLPFSAFIIGLTAGLIKARFIFIKSSKKNLTRIKNLEQPKVWQFFLPRFFLFLALMIATGVVLSISAQNNFGFLIAVASLDYSIAVALFVSGFIYIKEYI